MNSIKVYPDVFLTNGPDNLTSHLSRSYLPALWKQTGQPQMSKRSLNAYVYASDYSP